MNNAWDALQEKWKCLMLSTGVQRLLNSLSTVFSSSNKFSCYQPPTVKEKHTHTQDLLIVNVSIWCPIDEF